MNQLPTLFGVINYEFRMQFRRRALWITFLCIALLFLIRDGIHFFLVFALNQPLSPFALAALELLDPADVGYPLDVLSVIESTLDDPRQVLSAQQFKARGEAVAQMKADGLEYDARMELTASAPGTCRTEVTMMVMVNGTRSPAA